MLCGMCTLIASVETHIDIDIINALYSYIVVGNMKLKELQC